MRERDCIVGVPLKWVLTAQTELPPLPETDAASLLQIEAERGFHSDVTALQIYHSRSPLAGDKKFVLLAGDSQHAHRLAGKGFGGGKTETGELCARNFGAATAGG